MTGVSQRKLKRLLAAKVHPATQGWELRKFNAKDARAIQAGETCGRIVTRTGKEVSILEWSHDSLPMVSKMRLGEEIILTEHSSNGEAFRAGNRDMDLFLYVCTVPVSHREMKMMRKMNDRLAVGSYAISVKGEK